MRRLCLAPVPGPDFVISAASDESCAEWISAISDAVSAIKGGSTPAAPAAAPTEAPTEAPDQSATKIAVYYWPMLGRAGSLVRMLNEAKVPYVFKGPTDEAICAAFGAETGNFAPPIVTDGEFSLSQTTALNLYIGTKCGFVPDALNPFLAAKCEFLWGLAGSVRPQHFPPFYRCRLRHSRRPRERQRQGERGERGKRALLPSMRRPRILEPGAMCSAFS